MSQFGLGEGVAQSAASGGERERAMADCLVNQTIIFPVPHMCMHNSGKCGVVHIHVVLYSTLF